MVKVLHKCVAWDIKALLVRPEACWGKLLAAMAGVVLALTPVAASGKMPSASPDTNRGQQQEATPPPQASSATIEQTLAKRPQVSYEDGQLTIIAQNSSLSDVLSSLRTLMGTEIDIPASAAGQRIWVQLGPGPARRVLRDLLDGTEFNYVIQASDSDEEGIRSVLLTPKTKAGDSATGGPPGSPGLLPRGMHRGAPRDNPPAVEAPEQETPVPSAPPTAPDTAAAPPTDSIPPAQAAARELQQVQGTAGVPGGSGTPVATTTEQMIQQLQSMYQQRRQIQQQQNAKSPAPNP